MNVFSKKFWKDENVQACLRVSLRWFNMFVLFAIMCIFGSVSYWLMKKSEDTIFHDNFSATAQELSDMVGSLLLTVSQDGDTLANFQAVAYPNASAWPNAYINGFLDVGGTLKAASPPFGSLYIMPIVHPQNLSSFETYIRAAYERDPDVPIEAATHGFGFGVSADNNESAATGRGRSNSGNGDNEWITPIIAYYDYYDVDYYLWNAYADYPLAIKGVDGVYACVQAGNPSCKVLTESDNTGTVPGALIVTPIYPRNDPEELVGFVITAFTWNIVLSESVSALANDMFLVISTNDHDHFTTRFEQGRVIIEGIGDHHDKEFDMVSHQDSFSLNTEAEVSVTYTLKVYPTKEFYYKFHTSLPVVTTIFSALMIAITAMLFLVYDRFMKEDNETKRILLDVKRHLVRFVSGEIERPLDSAMTDLEAIHLILKNQLDNRTFDRRAVEELIKLVDDTMENTSEACLVVNDMLEYDKIELGNIQLNVDILSIWDFIAEEVDKFRMQALMEGTPLKTDDQRNSVGESRQNLLNSLFVLADKSHLARALRNLVSNALSTRKLIEGSLSEEARPFAKVKMEWHEHRLPDAKVLSLPEGHFAEKLPAFRRGSIVFSVTDNGPGMSAEELEEFLGEGVQFPVHKLQAGEGSGLGLYISKGIVTMHGGEIRAESEGVGKGSTFFIELPLWGRERGAPARGSFEAFSSKPVVHPDTPENNTGSRKKKSSRKKFGKNEYSSPMHDEETEEDDNYYRGGQHRSSVNNSMRDGEDGGHSFSFANVRSMLNNVLVVSGPGRHSNEMVASLKDQGFNVDVAEDGQSCMDILAMNSSAADVVLMDFSMAQISGPEAARLIRETCGSEIIIIGLMMSDNMPEDDQCFRNHGANEVMYKPFDLDTFVSVLEHLPLV